jgi:hypothetical protein
MDTAVLTTLIASGSAIGGVLVKMGYDSVMATIQSKHAIADRFLADRKAAYDKFWTLHRRVAEDAQRLHDLGLIARAGMTVKPEVLETFPPSSMGDLVEALDELRKMAHTGGIVRISERMLALHGDASAALRNFLDDDNVTYGLPFFLANRLREDQEREFIAAYRKDLGIAPPTGTRGGWPTVRRLWPLPEMERILHLHLKYGSHTKTDPGQPPKSLTGGDVKLIESSKFKRLIADEGASTEGGST